MLKKLLLLGCFFSFVSLNPIKKLFGDINNAPLFSFQYWTEHELEAMGPFFAYSYAPKHRFFALRPIFSYEKRPKMLTWDVFYPLIKYKKTPQETSFTFFPFINSTRSYKEYFPIFWGKTRQGESYGGFFPFYGVMKQRYDRKKITFVLWPLYIKSCKEDVNFIHILWPFFTSIKGRKRHGFKVWPIYGYDIKNGVFEKRYFLWPFFIWQKTALNTDRPQTYFTFFPFYISQSSPVMSSHTFIWPLFRVYRYKDYCHYDFPWPILGYSKGKNIKGIKFLPLFSYQEDPDQKSVFLFYPIYKYQIERTKNYTIYTNYILFIDRFEKRYDKSGKLCFKLAQMWPFYFYKFKNGRVKSHFPAILPIEDPGFERTLAPLLRIYSHEHDNQGNYYTKFGWGLYSHRKNGQKESWHLFPFFSVERERGYKSLSFLAGLFQIKTTQKGRQYKLFYFIRF